MEETNGFGTKPTMMGPAAYRIRVCGRLDAGWSDRLAGMQITESCGADGKPEAVLEGRLADQAALAGILNALYELHLPVIVVQYLGNDQ